MKNKKRLGETGQPGSVPEICLDIRQVAMGQLPNLSVCLSFLLCKRGIIRASHGVNMRIKGGWHVKCLAQVLALSSQSMSLALQFCPTVPIPKGPRLLDRSQAAFQAFQTPEGSHLSGGHVCLELDLVFLSLPDCQRKQFRKRSMKGGADAYRLV